MAMAHATISTSDLFLSVELLDCESPNDVSLMMKEEWKPKIEAEEDNIVGTMAGWIDCL